MKAASERRAYKIRGFVMSSLRFLAVPLLLATCSVATAGPLYYAHESIAGTRHGYGDVIGEKALFDTHSATVERTGNLLKVSIHPNFAGRADEHIYAAQTTKPLSKVGGK